MTIDDKTVDDIVGLIAAEMGEADGDHVNSPERLAGVILDRLGYELPKPSPLAHLTQAQRGNACSILNNVVVMQYARLGHTDEYHAELLKEYRGAKDIVVRLPFPNGVVSLQISDAEIIKAVRNIKDCLLVNRDKISEFLDEIDGIE